MIGDTFVDIFDNILIKSTIKRISCMFLSYQSIIKLKIKEKAFGVLKKKIGSTIFDFTIIHYQ